MRVFARSQKMFEGFASRFSVRSRRRKADEVVAFMTRQGVRSLLVIGAEENDHAWSNIVEKAAIAASADSTVTGLSLPSHALGGNRVLVCDGRQLPFGDDQFDFVLCNAVIEHVGQRADQKALVDEMMRVGRHFYLTTPNRWFPVESHTRAVFKHYSARWRGRRSVEFTRLLSRGEFRELLPSNVEIRGSWWSPSLRALR